jgi:methionyl aminopeptidase
MSYVEASDTSLRKTGQIKLHGASSFAGMRKAGALVAKCLDELTDIVKTGMPTSKIDDFVREFAFSHGAFPATLMYRQYRRHLHRRRLVRRFQPDVCDCADRAKGRAAD